MDTDESYFKPPYLSFQTFWKFVTDLSEKPLPPQIDRSMMDSKSGTDQASLTAALKGFELIRDDLTVESLLTELVNADEDGHKKVLARIIERHYVDPLRVSAENGTEKLLQDSFRESFGLDAAETRRKAITFFLHAARTADLPLSPHFPATRTAGQGGGGSPRSTRASKRKGDTGGGSNPKPSAGETKEIDFGEAGTVTLHVGVKWLDLPTEKMVALRGLVDQLEALGEPSWSSQQGGGPT